MLLLYQLLPQAELLTRISNFLDRHPTSQIVEKPPLLILRSPLKYHVFNLLGFTLKKLRCMKKILTSIHLGDTTKTILLAVGFIGLVMFLSYLYWFA